MLETATSNVVKSSFQTSAASSEKVRHWKDIVNYFFFILQLLQFAKVYRDLLMSVINMVLNKIHYRYFISFKDI